MRTPSADEKLVPVMIYTRNLLIRGETLCKQNVRVSIWLRTDGAPRYVFVQKAQVLVLSGGAPKAMSYGELLVPVDDVMAFHMLPPATEGVDYDENEKNRVNLPQDVILGSFVFKCKVRISTQSDMISTMEVAKAPWLAVYEINVSNHLIPQLSMRVDMALVRPNYVLFATQD